MRWQCVVELELHGEVVEWMNSLDDVEWRRTVVVIDDGRIILLTTFRKQRNNERNEITRARKAAEECAEQYP